MVIAWIARQLGGRARARVTLLLASSLALSGADLGAVGSMARLLQDHFSISKSQIGILVAASQGTGAFLTLVFGWLVDRTCRTRLLAWAVAGWGVAMLACGVATSYVFLLVTRIALGALAAATLPCTASLLGDYFPQRERGKIYGFILAGEIVGTGLGFMVCGQVADWWWRLGFWVLVLPVVPLVWALHKLPEPRRGGESQLSAGQPEIAPTSQPQQTGTEERLIAKKTRQAHISPRARLIRPENPRDQSLWWAVKYVLSIPTNDVLIIGSALGYAFFADVRTFGIEYAQAWFHISHSLAIWLLIILGLGAMCGVWLGGWLGDRLLGQGYVRARVWVATAGFWASLGLFLTAFLLRALWLAAILFVCAAFALGSVNPPLDSARLDIMHPELWGRAEGLRMIARDACEAIAPVSFGWLVAMFGDGGKGMHDGMLIMLIPLGVAAVLAFVTFRTYPPDAAAASAYARKTVRS